MHGIFLDEKFKEINESLNVDNAITTCLKAWRVTISDGEKHFENM